MEAQTDAPAGEAVAAVKQCSSESCAEPAVAQFDEQPFCAEHFARTSIREIESRSEQLRNQFDSTATASFQQFLANCSTQVKDLVAAEPAAQSPARDRLLDILLLISQVNQRLRRSPRTPASVPLWLRREDPGQTWEEETWTSSISRHGAGLVCRHRVEPGRTVYLCRKDRGGRATARVVYSRFDSVGDRQIGVEILDRDDFWDKGELSRAPEPVATQPAVAKPAGADEAQSGQAKPAPIEAAIPVQADVEIELAGQIVQYKNVALQFTSQGNETRLSATVPIASPDLKIESASSTSNESPMRIEIVWRNDKPVA
jgi:hypothetical protein